ncbi:MAG: hypothetical protein H7834_16070 [Magnetococcus sp. YQC-9]
MSIFLVKKKRGSGRFLSQDFDFAFSALFTKKHFSRLFQKNAPRAAKDCGIVLRLLQNNPANMAQEQSRVTKGFKV